MMPVFKPGDTIRITSGPFASFITTVEQVDTVKEILTARVEIFGRHTPVEVAFSEAEQVPPDARPNPPLTSLN